MLCMEFLIHGATKYNEPGLFVAFEENEKELSQNVASLGLDVKHLLSSHLLVLNHIEIDREQFTETGVYNLDGLFIQLADIINKYKIKRVALDTIEILFSNVANDSIVRSELQRIFRWFKSKNITILITGEQGINTFSRYGLEEYVADCVILLDDRIEHQISTRRIRVAKYRGSSHGKNEYPFIITEKGFVLTAITSMTLDYKASTKRISSGIKKLDNMLGNKGFFRGSSVLISGPAGIGKSSFGAAFANKTCEQGERCLYLAFEESVPQIVRNMHSIGLNLEQWLKKNLLKFHAINPNSSGLETHLTEIQHLTNEFKPSVVIIDPITNLRLLGNTHEVHDILSILIAFFKKQEITVMFLSLVTGEASPESAKTNEGISSLMDTWIFLNYLYGEGERNRVLSVLKSRGMKHSHQLREIVISDKGITLENVYLGQGKVLTGSARIIQASQLAVENARLESNARKKMEKLAYERKKIEQEIGLLHQKLKIADVERETISHEKDKIHDIVKKSRDEVSRIRMADSSLKRLTRPSKGKNHVKPKKNKTHNKKK
jgi:circadian clock protein KaiC